MSNPYFDAVALQIANGTRADAPDINNVSNAIQASFDLLPDPDPLNQGRVSWYVQTGAANAYTVTTGKNFTSYEAGMQIDFLIIDTNTGPSTLDVDGNGPVALTDLGGDTLAANAMNAGHIAKIQYDGTKWILLLTESATAVAAAQAAAAAAALSAAAADSSATDAAADAAAAAASAVAAAASAAALPTIMAGDAGKFLQVNGGETGYDFVTLILGDMLKSVYDPTNINASAFDRANHIGTQLASTISDFASAVSSNTAVAANTAKQTNVTTDLSIGTTTGTTLDINSSDGTNATIPSAVDSGTAGLLSGAKAAEITANTAKQTNVTTDLSIGTTTGTTLDINSSDGTNATIPSAVDSGTAGLLSGAKAAEITANTAKVSNATHTGDVTGSTALTIGSKKVTLSMLEDATAGELITYNASGVAERVSTGTNNQFLVSNGAGNPPTMQSSGVTSTDTIVKVNNTDPLNPVITRFFNKSESRRTSSVNIGTIIGPSGGVVPLTVNSITVPYENGFTVGVANSIEFTFNIGEQADLQISGFISAGDAGGQDDNYKFHVYLDGNPIPPANGGIIASNTYMGAFGTVAINGIIKDLSGTNHTIDIRVENLDGGGDLDTKTYSIVLERIN